MTRRLLLCAIPIGLMSTQALAADQTLQDAPAKSAPKVMSDAKMDRVVAGVDVVTKSGNLVWTVTNLNPPEGYNRGGKGNTASASGGLLKAVGAGGLSLAD